MNDEDYTYERSWQEIYDMLDKAERKQNAHLLSLNNKGLTKKQKIQHMRDFKGLQGVIYALRWSLGDKQMSKDKVLGDE